MFQFRVPNIDAVGLLRCECIARNAFKNIRRMKFQLVSECLYPKCVGVSQIV